VDSFVPPLVDKLSWREWVVESRAQGDPEWVDAMDAEAVEEGAVPGEAASVLWVDFLVVGSGLTVPSLGREAGDEWAVEWSTELIGRCSLALGGAAGTFNKVDADLNVEMVLLTSVVLLLPKEVDVDEETLVVEEETLEVRGWEEEDLDEEAFEPDFVVTVNVCFL
jgi:hypothetical protein